MCIEWARAKWYHFSSNIQFFKTHLFLFIWQKKMLNLFVWLYFSFILPGWFVLCCVRNAHSFIKNISLVKWNAFFLTLCFFYLFHCHAWKNYFQRDFQCLYHDNEANKLCILIFHMCAKKNNREKINRRHDQWWEFFFRQSTKPVKTATYWKKKLPVLKFEEIVNISPQH